MMECHGKYAKDEKQRIVRTVSVSVSRTGHPLILVLMSYEPALWKISKSEGAKISLVIIGGYHKQDITGLPDGVPVEIRSYEKSNCQRCSVQSDYFHAYDPAKREYSDVVERIRIETGLAPRSFQGAYTGDRFSIGSSVANAPLPAIAGHVQEDIVLGTEFSDELKLAQIPISLPEGRWKVLSYFNAHQRPSERSGLRHFANPDASGIERDLVVVLQESTGKNPAQLMAIRLQMVNDGSGFVRNKGCERGGDYVNETKENESFGNQLCYWVGYVREPWKQSLFSNAAQRLREGKEEVPDMVVAASFHKATKDISLDMLHYFLPAGELSKSSPFQTTSPWHRSNVAKDKLRHAFVDARKTEAEIWFQLFSMSY